MNPKQSAAGAEPQPARFGVVLAGGAATRMGGAKANAELAGRPLISYPVAAVERAGLEPVVVAKPGMKLGGVTARILHEPAEPRHPLCGVLAALNALTGPIVVVALDMPFVPSPLLAHIAAFTDPLAVPAPETGPEPLCARYSPSLTEGVASALERNLAMRDAVAEMGARLLDGVELARFGDPALMFRNINDPAGLAAAERLLSV